MDETTRPRLVSYSTTPVPVVQIPTVTSVSGPDGILTVDLPGTLLFAYDNASLLPSTDMVMQPLALKALSQHLQVSITGYASPDGGTLEDNLAPVGTTRERRPHPADLPWLASSPDHPRHRGRYCWTTPDCMPQPRPAE